MLYNGFGNVTKLSYKATGATSGPAELMSYYYESGNSYNKLSSISYSNGSSTQYSYDNFGNINEINNTLSGNNSSTTHRYYYDSLGNKVAELDLFDSEPSRIIYYNHNSVEIYSANELNYFASYDDEGDLYEIINGEVYTTKQNESVTDETTGDVSYKTVVSNTGETLSMTKLDDAFGRTKQKAVYSVDPGSNNITDDFSVVTTEYSYKTYPKDGETMTSSMIDTYDNRLYHGTSITENNLVSNYSYYYTYDNNGNITAEYSVNANGSRTLRYKYYYDEANQLVRLDDNIKSKTYDLIKEIVVGLVCLLVSYYFMPALFNNENYEVFDVKIKLNKYNLYVINYGCKDKVEDKYFVERVVYGSPSDWRNYGIENEYLGMSEYALNSQYYDELFNSYDNYFSVRNEIEGGGGDTPWAVNQFLIDRFLRNSHEKELVENRMYVQSLEYHTYYGKAKKYKELMVVYKKYKSLAWATMKVRMINYSIPDFDDADYIGGI